MVWWRLGGSAVISIAGRLFLTPVQIVTKRFAEENPRFRAAAARFGRWYNKLEVKQRFSKNHVVKTPEQLELASKISEHKAIVICAEVLSSFIGTVSTIVILLITAYHKEAEKQAEQARQKEITDYLADENDQLEGKLDKLQTQIDSLFDNTTKELPETNQTFIKMRALQYELARRAAKQDELEQVMKDSSQDQQILALRKELERQNDVQESLSQKLTVLENDHAALKYKLYGPGGRRTIETKNFVVEVQEPTMK